MALPYPSAGIPIGPQPRPDDGLGSTSEGRARLAAMRRLSLDQPDMDHAAMMAAAPVAMAEDRAALSAKGPTVLQPSRTAAFTGRDAQSLSILDPRALAEANAQAALDQPKKMTGTFNGQSFEMTPSQRVGRDQLAQIYGKYQGIQSREAKAKELADAQSGRERLVSIPGEQGIKKRGMELESEERQGGAERAFKTPTRDADIAAKGASTAAVTGAEGRAQVEHGERINPQQASIDEQYTKLAGSPFAQTPSVRAALKMLLPQTSFGKQLPSGVAGAVAEGTAPDVSSSAIAEIDADPGIASIVDRATKSSPGMFTGGQGRATGAAARRVAESTITAKLRERGVPEPEIQDYIIARLGAPAQAGAGNGAFGKVATAPLRVLPGGGQLADAITGR